MVKKKIFFPVIFMVLIIALSNSTFAIEWEHNCTDGTLFKNATIFINGTAYDFNQTVICANGCANNETCNSPINVEPEYYMVIVLVVLFSALIFAYLATKFEGSEFVFGVMQYFFMLVSLSLIIAAFGIITSMVNLGQLELIGILSGSYMMVLYAMIIFLILIILKIIYDAAVKTMGNAK